MRRLINLARFWLLGSFKRCPSGKDMGAHGVWLFCTRMEGHRGRHKSISGYRWEDEG